VIPRATAYGCSERHRTYRLQVGWADFVGGQRIASGSRLVEYLKGHTSHGLEGELTTCDSGVDDNRILAGYRK
jgi:hypothetical protein